VKFSRRKERRKMGKIGKKEGEGGLEDEEGGWKMRKGEGRWRRRRRREGRGKGLGWVEARWKRKGVGVRKAGEK
jgi:hypothetical protein